MNAEALKKPAFAVLIAAALFVGGYFAGKSAAPAKVEEHTATKDAEKEKAKEETKEKVSDNKTINTTDNTHVHKEEHVFTHKDGTVETTKTEDTNTQKVEVVHDIQYVEKEVVKTVEKVVVHEKTVDRIVTARQVEWKFGLLAGADLTHLGSLGTPLPVGLLGQPWLLGLQVEHRLVIPIVNIPVWAGAWGTTGRQVGISVGFEF